MILALRSLLDAASLTMSQQAANDHTVFAPLAQMLDGWSDRLGTTDEDIGRLILDALEVEIQRWEARSTQEEEARSVLRAFLGLREFLWELGIRPTPADTAKGSDDVAPQNASDDAPTSPSKPSPAGA